MIQLNKIAIVACGLMAVTLGTSAGKIKFNEFTIKKTTDKASPLLLRDLTFPASANCVIAGINRGASPHVKVFSGRMSQASVQVLMGDGSVRFISISVGNPPMAPSSSQNNLKQMTLASINFDELRIGLMRPAGAGQVQEYKTVRLLGARMTERSSPPGTAFITFTGLEAAPYIGTANGGVWKTTNF